MPAEWIAGIAQVRHFLEVHALGRFRRFGVWKFAGDEAQSDATGRERVQLAGFRRQGKGGAEYFVLPEVWRNEVAVGFDPGELAAEMVRRKLIRPDPVIISRNVVAACQIARRAPALTTSCPRSLPMTHRGDWRTRAFQARLAHRAPRDPSVSARDQAIASIRQAALGAVEITRHNLADVADPSASIWTEADHPSQDPLDGAKRAARLRPPRWTDPASAPSQDARCSRCGSGYWRLSPAEGWSCRICHPAEPGASGWSSPASAGPTNSRPRGPRYCLDCRGVACHRQCQACRISLFNQRFTPRVAQKPIAPRKGTQAWARACTCARAIARSRCQAQDCWLPSGRSGHSRKRRNRRLSI